MSQSSIIHSLTRQELIEYIFKNGLDAFAHLTSGKLIALVGTGSQVITDYAQRQALEAQSQAYKEFKDNIPKFLEAFKEKEIKVISETFNSSPRFTDTFKSAGDLYTVPILLYSAVEAIKQIGHALDGIKDELSLSNVAKIQGWENDGFGSHVHRFVRNEMQSASQKQGAGDTREHYFYVWHPDTSWYQTFEELLREKPLGHNFGGYHSDLATISIRMSCDRATLAKHTETGRAALFHLLVPAYEPIVVKDPVEFHPDMCPLDICGQKHRGVELVWFRFRQHPDRGTVTVSHIGQLPNSYLDANMYIAGGLIAGCSGMVAAGIGAMIFPPLAPAMELLFFGSNGLGLVTGWGAAGAKTYLEWGIPSGSRVLGARVQLETSDETAED